VVAFELDLRIADEDGQAGVALVLARVAALRAGGLLIPLRYSAQSDAAPVQQVGYVCHAAFS
jgi:hypothetical protein